MTDFVPHRKHRDLIAAQVFAGVRDRLHEHLETLPGLRTHAGWGTPEDEGHGSPWVWISQYGRDGGVMLEERWRAGGGRVFEERYPGGAIFEIFLGDGGEVEVDSGGNRMNVPERIDLKELHFGEPMPPKHATEKY